MASLKPVLGVVALVATGGLALWRVSTQTGRNERSQQRAFLVDYEATVRGLRPLSQVRQGWRARLAKARTRYGENDVRTLVVRCRLMTFDELADDVSAAAEQIDAVIEHVAALDEQTRWLFVAGLHWLTWRTRRRSEPDRCRPAFERLVVAELPVAERVAVGVRLAHAAAQGGRLEEARWILERASQAIAKAATTTEASPYRSSPAGDNGSNPNAALGFEVMCERVRIETNAGELAGARTALAELDQWVLGLPNAEALLDARARHWQAMVARGAGALAAAERGFAQSADAFSALTDDEDAATHTQSNLVAWVDTLLDLHRPGEAATVARRAQQGAQTPANHAEATGRLAAALVQLGQDEEAQLQLATLPVVGEDGSAAVMPVRALLALRSGDTARALRLTRRALAALDRSSPLATTGWLTLGRVLAASGRPRLAERVVAGAAMAVIASVGPAHPRLAPLYRFLSERQRADGRDRAAATLDEAADHLFSLASA